MGQRVFFSFFLCFSFLKAFTIATHACHIISLTSTLCSLSVTKNNFFTTSCLPLNHIASITQYQVSSFPSSIVFLCLLFPSLLTEGPAFLFFSFLHSPVTLTLYSSSLYFCYLGLCLLPEC